MSDNIKEQITSDTNTSKCPSCGATLVWSPQDKCLKCEHCDTTVAVELNRFGEELNFASVLDGNNSWGAETHVFQCKNCGAREILAKNEISKVCPFCGATNVVETNELSGLRPNAIVPFELDKASAVSNFKKWSKRKWFAPNKYQKNVKADEIYGNYSPAFTFDTNTFSSYSGKLGEYYYVNVKRKDKTVRERKIKYFDISGDYCDCFDDIVVLASTQIPTKYFSQLDTFNTNNSHEYADDFLYGFSATQYSKDGKHCWTEARSRISDIIKQRILAKYKYDVVVSFNFNTSCSDIKYKYILLPVYVGHSTWRNKIYNFYINGVSGVVRGKSPLSPIKVGALVAAITVIAVTVAVLVYFKVGG